MRIALVLALLAITAPAITAPRALADPATVHVAGPSGPLGGIIARPAGTSPSQIAIIIPGSGDVDADGRGPGLHSDTYQMLASALAGNGIETIRIDKRGLFSSAAAAANPNGVTASDYAADLDAWIGFARSRAPAACVWLIGHSEGGLIALLAAQGQAGICGLVLLATPAIPLGELLRRQIDANPANAPVAAPANQIIDALEASRMVDVSHAEIHLRALFRPAVQGLLISEFRLDPVALARKLTVPITVVEAGRDLQVTPADIARFRSSSIANLAVVEAPNANHVLKDVTETMQDNLLAYRDPSRPLSPAITRLVTEAVRNHPHAATDQRLR